MSMCKLGARLYLKQGHFELERRAQCLLKSPAPSEFAANISAKKAYQR